MLGFRVHSGRSVFEEAGVWQSGGSHIPPCPLATGPAAGTPFAAHVWSCEDDQAQRTCQVCGLPLPRPEWAKPGPAPMPSAEWIKAALKAAGCG